MSYVAKGNEAWATAEVMAKVALIAEKMQKMRELRDEVSELAQDADLYHLDISWDFDIDCDPVNEHERWLASSHNC